MRILISGSSGLIGTALVNTLKSRGHEVIRLVRKLGSEPDVRYWNPEGAQLSFEGFGDVDVVVNLAGENIGASRWANPEARKRVLLDSRVKSTSLLARSIAALEHPPELFISASAMGYYGDRGDELLTEENRPGNGFMSDLCVAWESAALPAKEKGIRTVYLRTAMVLAPNGGALARMLPLFRLGLGGKFGNGKQFVSWITIDDVVGAVLHIMYNEGLTGAVNLASPEPVTNAEFTRALAKVLHRPAIFSVPSWALRIAAGEIASPLILDSIRVEPSKLLANNYSFEYPALDGALVHLLAR
jgi:uncharacterized protein (TIGR01777 family)